MSVPKLTKEQAAIIGAYTGFALGPFGDIQEYAEKLFGEPVFTHEFADESTLERMKALSKPDLIALCYELPADAGDSRSPSAS